MNKEIKNITRYIALALYYCLARFLPSYPLGRRFRRFLCSKIFNKCGNNINVEKMAYFGLGNDIEIGNNSGIGIKSKIYGIGGGGRIFIGENVVMAPEVTILTLIHNYEDSVIPINQQKTESSDVIIEDDVWIGYRVIILPGVKVGKGAVIGAGAVVTKNVDSYMVVGGIPARYIKKRGKI